MNDNNADMVNSEDKKQNNNTGNLIKAAVMGVVVGGAAVAIANKQNRDNIQKAMHKTEKNMKSKIKAVQKSADQLKVNSKKQIADRLGEVQKKLLNNSK